MKRSRLKRGDDMSRCVPKRDGSGGGVRANAGRGCGGKRKTGLGRGW